MAEILIVDTDKRSGKDISDILDASEYRYLQVYTAYNARRAMVLLKQQQPNALLIDISLPDMDGIEFGKIALQLYPDLSVIIITQLQMFEIAHASINAGFSAYLLKPIVGNELIDTFDRVLKPFLKKEISQALDYPDEFNLDLRNPLQSAIQYMQLHYMEQLTLKEIAEKIYLSPSYFSKLFKEEMDMTFVEYLSWVRIQKSKKMLRMTSIPIDVIANNTGFANSSYFATTFKKIEGRTPSQYRDLFS